MSAAHRNEPSRSKGASGELRTIYSTATACDGAIRSLSSQEQVSGPREGEPVAEDAQKGFQQLLNIFCARLSCDSSSIGANHFGSPVVFRRLHR